MITYSSHCPLSVNKVSFVAILLDFQHKMAVLMPLIFIPPSFFMINLTIAIELFSEAPSQRIISHSFSRCEMEHLGLNMNLIVATAAVGGFICQRVKMNQNWELHQQMLVSYSCAAALQVLFSLLLRSCSLQWFKYSSYCSNELLVACQHLLMYLFKKRELNCFLCIFPFISYSSAVMEDLGFVSLSFPPLSSPVVYLNCWLL